MKNSFLSTKLFLGTLISILPLTVASQLSVQAIYGNNGNQYGNWVVQTADEGFVIAAQNDDFTGNGYNAWIVRTNSGDDTLWTRLVGGAAADNFTSIVETANGDIAAAGYQSSFGAGGEDIWLVLFDNIGNVKWAKTYGGTGNDEAYVLKKTNDGGFIIVGSSNSFNINWDVYVIRTDSMGDTLWTRTYGGSGTDRGRDVLQTPDGGFVIVGESGFGQGNSDVYLLKIDSVGAAEWSKAYGTSSAEYGKPSNKPTTVVT
ncbi:MAG: hypothetical protein IH946_04285 [Bacteroidetes bacterium]|nr:hypothetical protein [Bacteroidota bacterium]